MKTPRFATTLTRFAALGLALALTPLAASVPAAPDLSFNSGTLALPPLMLGDLTTPRPQTFASDSLRLTPPPRPPLPRSAPPRASNRGMPVIEPDPSKDFKILLATPKPGIDYKMIVEDPAPAARATSVTEQSSASDPNPPVQPTK